MIWLRFPIGVVCYGFPKEKSSVRSARLLAGIHRAKQDESLRTALGPPQALTFHCYNTRLLHDGAELVSTSLLVVAASQSALSTLQLFGHLQLTVLFKILGESWDFTLGGHSLQAFLHTVTMFYSMRIEQSKAVAYEISLG